MKKKDLNVSEYDPYFSGYLSLVPEDIELISGFEDNTNDVLEFFQSIPSGKLNYRYAEGKWSTKEVFQHLIDAERVFQFRCFHFARHDKTPIPGFDENAYIAPSRANDKTLESLIEEFKGVRRSFTVLLKSLTHEDLTQVGDANGSPKSARAVAFINLGHYQHHINIIKERYL